MPVIFIPLPVTTATRSLSPQPLVRHKPHRAQSTRDSVLTDVRAAARGVGMQRKITVAGVATLCMRERINADDPVALAPGVPPEMQPLAYGRREARPRRTTRRILRAGVLLLAHDEIRCEKNHASAETYPEKPTNTHIIHKSALARAEKEI